jgi:hypothetical protein
VRVESNARRKSRVARSSLTRRRCVSRCEEAFELVVKRDGPESERFLRLFAGDVTGNREGQSKFKNFVFRLFEVNNSTSLRSTKFLAENRATAVTQLRPLRNSQFITSRNILQCSAVSQPITCFVTLFFVINSHATNT